AEKILCMGRFFCLVSISNYGKFHSQSIVMLRKDAIFFSECCQHIAIICTFVPNYKPNYDEIKRKYK
ncbi:hypothetical protein, partial [uncultured Bacteroides sp.]|uniref:hypothetical protein n=1 Tax=uncultured Bacteroides sp. TaxID=162156 RepID=UPI0025989653